MNLSSLTPQQLRQAADLTERIDALKNQLSAILGGEESSSPAVFEAAAAPKTGKKPMSREGRTRIRAAAKARWAAWRRGKAGATSAEASSKPIPADKKLHWTQRPGAKARMSKAAKMSWRKRRQA